VFNVHNVQLTVKSDCVGIVVCGMHVIPLFNPFGATAVVLCCLENRGDIYIGIMSATRHPTDNQLPRGHYKRKLCV
jgi:hypothetical protein